MSHGSRRRQAAISFVGRAGELAHLRAAWDAASQGSARLVAIEGETGVAKTALIDELLKAEPRLAPQAQPTVVFRLRV
jgi:Cdc6-like AAA superfamily ATPase